MKLELCGKSAVVCAASRGLGRAVAESLASEGVGLVLVSRDAASLTDIATTLNTKYDIAVHAIACDLSQADSPMKIADLARSKFGKIDILVNNTGGPKPTEAQATTREQWQSGFEGLFLSATGLISQFLPAMKEAGYGRIITITSLSVVEPIPHLAVSTAMRAALTAYTKNLADEVASSGVTAHTIMPGVIHTQRIENLRQAKAERDGTSLEDELAATRNNIPTKRLGRPEELADLVTFLSSPKASYLNGLNIPVDGGLRRGWV